MQKKQPIWIDTPSQLNQLLADILVEPIVAVDTESDSLYSYFEKVCLIQFSTPKTDYLVDPLSVNVAGLANFFANPNIQKVFHAVEYDLLCLKRDYGFTFHNLFDTMIAARILGWSGYGLGPILEKYFKVKLDKRFQRYNWSKRPLETKALEYAHLDTHYLLALREMQLVELTKRNRLREAEDAFERATLIEPTPKVFNPDDFWRIKGTKDLTPQQQAILRELFMLRDKIARKLNRPSFKVMQDEFLLKLAEQQPLYPEDLRNIGNLGKTVLQHYIPDILKAIEVGQQAPYPNYPRSHQRVDEDTMFRYEMLRQWRNDLAVQRGVEPDVIISNHCLMNIAQQNLQTIKTLEKTGILSEWQLKNYGTMVIEVLQAN